MRMTRRQFVASSSGAFVAGGLATSGTGFGDQAKTGSGRSRVIIDTDPGVDDALALLLAMRSPELTIEGITPVAGNVPLELTLPNALRMVEVAGRTDIPVAGGAAGKPVWRPRWTAPAPPPSRPLRRRQPSGRAIPRRRP